MPPKKPSKRTSKCNVSSSKTSKVDAAALNAYQKNMYNLLRSQGENEKTARIKAYLLRGKKRRMEIDTNREIASHVSKMVRNIVQKIIIQDDTPQSVSTNVFLDNKNSTGHVFSKANPHLQKQKQLVKTVNKSLYPKKSILTLIKNPTSIYVAGNKEYRRIDAHKLKDPGIQVNTTNATFKNVPKASNVTLTKENLMGMFGSNYQFIHTKDDAHFTIKPISGEYIESENNRGNINLKNIHVTLNKKIRKKDNIRFLRFHVSVYPVSESGTTDIKHGTIYFHYLPDSQQLKMTMVRLEKDRSGNMSTTDFKIAKNLAISFSKQISKYIQKF